MRKVYALSALLLVVFVLTSGCVESPDVNVESEKTLSVNGVTVHYSGKVSTDQAKALINLINAELNPNEIDVYVKKDNGYVVGLTSTYTSSSEMEDSLKFYLIFLASKMSQDVFSGEKVLLQILDDEKNVLYQVESKYRYVSSSGINVWYRVASEEEARKALDYLVEFAGQGPWDVILEKSGSTYHVRAMSSFTTADEANSAKDAYTELVSGLEERLNGDVVVHVLDPNGIELTTFGP
ncbi:hypothetical protein, conserved [Thermococcus kodakarensis KOD1]|uniref:Uncharacterized protein n=1 Tax=Thermococcus kodakarensis (strain ATCC BAA-918 / JCM 12380 / KOD1) TaxID=69014 RepID=Q5JHK7_THEKO|nr:hypothetical protein [Thermococcus kodakarensis]WCN28024.1 hypothetical protein POG15_11145 [Thermococcus kodakarensis]WCN30321.1 hypothetical protein POG21_11125 [Thermococcus kodakarensis]BAD86373.1 hypothetical protein, conserved [Thermococcus kodakarensis KOD1]